MILRALAYFLLLLGAYWGTVTIVEPSLKARAVAYFDADQDYVQANEIRAQGLLYDDLTGRDVYLGSSLSTRLADGLLPSPFAKKEFIGGGPITGLEVLAMNRTRPKRVFIESNYAVARAANEKILADLGGRPMGPLRQRFRVLRRTNRPTNLLLMEIFAPRIEIASAVEAERRRQARLTEPILVDDLVVDPDHVRRSLAHLGPEYAGAKLGFAIWLPVLEEAVRKLEADGVQVCFYRMPFHEEVENDEYYNRMNQMLRQAFPPEKFRWIMPDEKYRYQTTDGFHLTWKSGVAYTRHFLNQLESDGGISRPVRPSGGSEARSGK